MPLYRKKPVVIEAIQWDGRDHDALAAFLGPEMYSHVNYVANPELVPVAAHISTLEGIMTASPGDWVIKGVQGEFYPCKPDVFGATYELVTDPGPAAHSR